MLSYTGNPSFYPSAEETGAADMASVILILFGILPFDHGLCSFGAHDAHIPPFYPTAEETGIRNTVNPILPFNHGP